MRGDVSVKRMTESGWFGEWRLFELRVWVRPVDGDANGRVRRGSVTEGKRPTRERSEWIGQAVDDAPALPTFPSSSPDDPKRGADNEKGRQAAPRLND